MITLKNILVPIDFSEPSDAALMYGRALASRFGATLHIFHAVQSIYIGTLGAEHYAAFTPIFNSRLKTTRNGASKSWSTATRLGSRPSRRS